MRKYPREWIGFRTEAGDIVEAVGIHGVLVIAFYVKTRTAWWHFSVAELEPLTPEASRFLSLVLP